MPEQTSGRNRCTVCHLPRTAAAKGECNVPMPAPQPPQCLMVTIEREELDRRDRMVRDVDMDAAIARWEDAS